MLLAITMTALLLGPTFPTGGADFSPAALWPPRCWSVQTRTLTKDGSGLEKNLRTSPKSVEKLRLASFPSCLLTSQFTDRQYLRHDSVSCELEAQPGPRASLLTGAFSWKQT